MSDITQSFRPYEQDDESIAGSEDNHHKLSDEQYSDDDDRVDLSDDEGSFGNNEEEEEEEEIQIGDTQRQWKIQHSSGDMKMKAMEFINHVKANNFTPNTALAMFHERRTMDYGKKRGPKAADPVEEYWPQFFIDLVILVGRPLQPITQDTSLEFFDNITLTFKKWSAPYSSKHIHGLAFDLQHRTFRVATASSRFHWFIVMHPKVRAPEEIMTRGQRRKRREKSSRSSALQKDHAQFIARYIIEVFKHAELLGSGVESSWELGNERSTNLSVVQWSVFETLFMQGWRTYLTRVRTQDSFWTDNEPALHTYDYGANIKIDLQDQLRAIPKEDYTRPLDTDSSDDSDAESTYEDARDTPETQSSYEHCFTGGMQKLRDSLEANYRISNLETVSYALAISIYHEVKNENNGEMEPCNLLANRNKVALEYHSPNDYTFYPLAFHPAYGNFSSPRPPQFLMDNLLLRMQQNMMYQHNGVQVLTFGYFQAYSNIKRVIRHTAKDLLATKGLATAALTLSSQDDGVSQRVLTRQARFLRRLQGLDSPSDCEAARPFFRERKQLELTIEENEMSYRMEQVISFQVSQLKEGTLSFTTVLTPIFQLIRFFLRESDHYTHILRSFQPSIFPGVLVAFSTLFGQAFEGLQQQCAATGQAGPGVALSEGIAALDRLGSYCFTGFPSSLVGSVLKPLGTIESIELHGWPYIDPRMLDIQGSGRISLSKWPRSSIGRPILMHPQALSFHYGKVVGASRATSVWFRELGGLDVQGPASASKFLVTLFDEMWKPQMTVFLKDQFQRILRDDRPRGGQAGQISPEQRARIREEHTAQFEKWSDSNERFTWTEYETMLPLTQAEYQGRIQFQTRRDFAAKLYNALTTPDSPTGLGLCSTHATWFPTLRSAVRYTRKDIMQKEQWINTLTGALVTSSIDCMPGIFKSKLSARYICRLNGPSNSLSAAVARPDSKKRARIEAEERTKRPRIRKRRISFGCKVPFDAMPELLQTGFAEQEKQFKSKDGDRQGIINHYQTVYEVLARWLGDPLCDYVLMIVLTMASSSETPTVEVGATEFSIRPDRKQSNLFAVALVTRLLWYFRPECFPATRLSKKPGGALSIQEMQPKMEQKGVNNRMIKVLDCIQLKKGSKRDSPRYTDLEVVDLYTRHKKARELMAQRSNAEAFIGSVFQCVPDREDNNWLARCASIIVDD